MLHGQPNIKICIAKQAKQIFQYNINCVNEQEINVSSW